MLKINKYATFICIFFLVIISCKTNKPLELPHNTNQRVISVGAGGGFTGVGTTYHLLEDGNLYRNGLNDTSFYHVTKLDQTMVKQQFGNYDMMKLGEVQYDLPGNRYYFLEMKNGSKRHKIQWGRTEMENKDPDLLYSLLMKIISKENEKQ